MELTHRFNWHYAPPIYPEGDTVLWCQWCGLRFKKANFTEGMLTITGTINKWSVTHGD